MPSIDIVSENAYCTRCGKKYGKRKGNFPVNYGQLYKGTGYLGICRECTEDLYLGYLAACKDPKMAMRQLCRKLDIYWSDEVFLGVEKKNAMRNIATGYLARINVNSYINKSYDDTLHEEGKLWDFRGYSSSPQKFAPPAKEEAAAEAAPAAEAAMPQAPQIELTQEIIDYWGPGLSSQQYTTLEQRRQYHLSRLAAEKGVDVKDIDMGTDMLIRQICNLEIDINAGRSDGKDVNKSVSTLVDLLQKIDWKPAKKEDVDSADSNTPLGVWILRWENKRPLPEIDEDLKDVNGLKKYLFTWMGHLCKMLGIKGGYTKLYEEEIERLRVAMPEYSEEDDETLISDAYSESELGDPP